MGTIVMSGTVVLVILGFGNHVYWLAAVAVLLLYVQYGRGSSAPSGGAGGGAAGGSAPADYRSYRERPFEARRQAREKAN